MGFYDLEPAEREQVVRKIHQALKEDLEQKKDEQITSYFSDPDTYIRKAAYQSIGRLYTYYPLLHTQLILLLNQLVKADHFHIRQTAINAAGEIGKKDFELVQSIFEQGLFDPHHAPRNAVIGSIKKMGELNPIPVLNWCKQYLKHEDKEIRREICHGIELRGRKHPQDILPMLRELEFDESKRVRSTLIHVLGQIAYKKGCLELVIQDLKQWNNKELVNEALEEIIDVHHRYRNFAFYTQDEAIHVIESSEIIKEIDKK